MIDHVRMGQSSGQIDDRDEARLSSRSAVVSVGDGLVVERALYREEGREEGSVPSYRQEVPLPIAIAIAQVSVIAAARQIQRRSGSRINILPSFCVRACSF